jgi:tetratricopeptide (TPR) repeat protein
MMKISAYLSLAVVVCCLRPASAALPGGRTAKLAALMSSRALSHPQAAPEGQAAAAKGPTWKSRAEYDAFQTMYKTADPKQQISLADAFIQKYADSDFKYQAYLIKMSDYQKLGDSADAIKAAKQSLQLNENNLAALHYLAFAFPFVYKANAPDKDAEISQAQTYAKQGLEILQKLPPPAAAQQAAFEKQVKQYRADFNRALGFAALQQKDYASALTYLKAAAEDDPSDSYTASFLGQAYYYSKPPDYNNAIWYLARSVSLAKAANSPNAGALQKFYNQVYVERHGSDAGENGILTQAATADVPASGFNIAPPPKHAKTGDPLVDGFYAMEDALVVGGDQAQREWSALKGQPFAGHGSVDAVEPGTDPGTLDVHLDITPESKTKDGVYDLDLVTNQADAKYLKKGDLLRFNGTISAYTVTPSFVITLSPTTINSEDLEAAKSKAQAKAVPKRRRHR